MSDGRSLGEMLADVPKTVTTPELRVDCPDAIKFDVVRAVTEHYKTAGNAVIDTDGARVTFASKSSAPAWGLVRASNTGPILVMRVEAGSQVELDAIKSDLDAVVAKARRERGA